MTLMSDNTPLSHEELQALLEESRAVGADVDALAHRINAELDEIEAGIHADGEHIDALADELDAIEAETGEELDMLMLERAEDLGSDE